MINGIAFRVSSLRELDIDPLIALERRSNPFPLSDRQLREFFDSDVNTTFTLIENHRYMGFITYQTALDTADIVHLVIEEAQQGKGLATWLLTKTLSQLQQSGIHTCFLEVRESNSVARQLYKNVGFIETGKRKNYYIKPKEHAVLMRYHQCKA